MLKLLQEERALVFDNEQLGQKLQEAQRRRQAKEASLKELRKSAGLYEKELADIENLKAKE